MQTHVFARVAYVAAVRSPAACQPRAFAMAHQAGSPGRSARMSQPVHVQQRSLRRSAGSTRRGLVPEPIYIAYSNATGSTRPKGLARVEPNVASPVKPATPLVAGQAGNPVLFSPPRVMDRTTSTKVQSLALAAGWTWDHRPPPAVYSHEAGATSVPAQDATPSHRRPASGKSRVSTSDRTEASEAASEVEARFLMQPEHGTILRPADNFFGRMHESAPAPTEIRVSLPSASPMRPVKVLKHYPITPRSANGRPASRSRQGKRPSSSGTAAQAQYSYEDTMLVYRTRVRSPAASTRRSPSPTDRPGPAGRKHPVSWYWPAQSSVPPSRLDEEWTATRRQASERAAARPHSQGKPRVLSAGGARSRGSQQPPGASWTDGPLPSAVAHNQGATTARSQADGSDTGAGTSSSRQDYSAIALHVRDSTVAGRSQQGDRPMSSGGSRGNGGRQLNTSMKPWIELARTFERDEDDVIVSRWPLDPHVTSTRRRFEDLEEDDDVGALPPDMIGDIPVPPFPQPEYVDCWECVARMCFAWIVLRGDIATLVQA